MENTEKTLNALRLLVEYEAAAALELIRVANQIELMNSPSSVRDSLEAIERTQVLAAAWIESLKNGAS